MPGPPFEQPWCWPPPLWCNNDLGSTSYQTDVLEKENVPSRYLRSPESPLDSPLLPGPAGPFSPSLPPVPNNGVEPLLYPQSSCPPLQRPDESFPPPVAGDDFISLLTPYQLPALAQENVPFRYPYSTEPPLHSPSSWPPLPGPAEPFSPSLPPVPNNGVDPLLYPQSSCSPLQRPDESFPPPVAGDDFISLLTPYQLPALAQENVPFRYPYSTEPPLHSPSSWPPLPGLAEPFLPSLPRVPSNDVGLASYQAAAPENVPSRTVEITKSLIRESDLPPETDLGGSSQLTSGLATGTEGRGGDLTRPKKKKTGIAAQRERTKNITREDLEQLFHLPREQAAQVLGLSVTTLKKLNRKHGIPRWPYERPGQPK